MMNPTATRTPKRLAARQGLSRGRTAAQREKCTLQLERDLSLKLTVAAHLRGLDRSDLVNELLSEALRHVVISLRGQATLPAHTDRPGEGAEISSTAPSEAA
jgi:hypothetical protein